MAEVNLATEPALETVETAEALRHRVTNWRNQGLGIGFVPTMGALHEGHLALVRRAAELTDRVVASVFVNPTQFGPDEDFERYPRDVDTDRQLLGSAGCHLLFLPAITTIYPEGHSTFVEVEEVSRGLEGEQRRGHFRGVATVVTQLLNLVQPHVAVFGQKDGQQLAVIRRLVRDLHLPVEIVGHATVREEDGLALSSRNVYLSTAERRAATVLFRALTAARRALEAGERSADTIRGILRTELASEPQLTTDYAEVVDADTFQPVQHLQGNIVLPVAGRIGGTRLLDNFQINMDELES